MAKYHNPQFRLTLWPRNTLPLPDAWAPATEVRDGWLVTEEHWEDTLGREPAPYHEAYLKLAQIDLEDEKAIGEWLREHGPLGVSWNAWTNEGQRFEWERLSGFTDHPGFRRIARPVLEAARGNRLGAGETVEEFRWAARCLRDLFTAWRYYAEGKEPGAWESPIWRYTEPEDDEGEISDIEDWEIDIQREGLTRLAAPPESRSEAGVLLAGYLSEGLAPFHPHILVPQPSPLSQAPYGGRQTFYAICCLELYNHIVEQATYKTCANERCGRLFVRQSGRAKHGQHRTSAVKYCSYDCARAQASREHRRRKTKPR